MSKPIAECDKCPYVYLENVIDMINEGICITDLCEYIEFNIPSDSSTLIVNKCMCKNFNKTEKEYYNEHCR